MSVPGIKGPSQRRTLIILVVAFVLSLTVTAGMLVPTVGRTAAVTDPAPTPLLTVEERTALEARYSPVMMFSSGERTFPVNVEYFITNCRLVGYPNGGSVDRPDPDDLGGPWRAGYYLDHSSGTRSDAGAIARYELDRSMVNDTVYVRTVEKAGKIIIQYWLFYVFNQGTFNSHEGDWEMVQVILDRRTMGPSSVTLSQHHNGGRTSWAGLTEKDLAGTHPVVLVATGSHANYLPSGLMRAPGDRVDGAGEVLAPSDYRLVPIGQEGGTSPSWLLFQGSWGETTSMGGLLGTGGPVGPMYRENGLMWDGLGWGA